MAIIKIRFGEPMMVNPLDIESLIGIAGVYFVFTKSIFVKYRFGGSRLLYIGFSERKTNSICSKLIENFWGPSKNTGLLNYTAIDQLYFTYIDMELLISHWEYSIDDLERCFLLDFIEQSGEYPVCNTEQRTDMDYKTIEMPFDIEWSYFK